MADDEKFLNEAWGIDEDIRTINGNIQQIQALNQKLLTATSQQQEWRNAGERTELMDQTRTQLIALKDRIKKLGQSVAKTKREDWRQRHGFLAQKLKNTVNDYRVAEEAYMRQQKERVVRQYRVVNPDATQTEIDQYVSNSDNQPVFQQALLRTGEARAALQEVQERHKDIKQIEQTVSELATLFQEIQLQVEEQDETIADIETGAQEAAVKVEEANVHLDKARLSALSARRKKWICLGIAVVIVAILVIVLVSYLPKHNKNNNDNSNNSSSETSTVTSTVTSTSASETPSQ